MSTRSPMVHLLCGYNAAGKSTLARRLARSMPAARFSLDERMIGRFSGLDYADAAYGAAVDGEREALWREALVVLADGVDVVLDWNCWRAADRVRWSGCAADAGADALVHWLDVPPAVALARSRNRNAAADPTVHCLRDADVEAMILLFEPPVPKEGLSIRRYDRDLVQR